MNEKQSKGAYLNIEKNKIGSQHATITRKAFRNPYDESDALLLTIKNKKYSIINFEIQGISFRLMQPDTLLVGDTLDNMEIECNGQKFQFSGKIIHITPFEIDHKFHGSSLCGVCMTTIDPQTKKQFQKMVHETRARLMKH